MSAGDTYKLLGLTLVICLLIVAAMVVNSVEVTKKLDADAINLQALEEAVGGYQEREQLIVVTLSHVAEVLDLMAYGPYSREEMQDMLIEMVDIIQSINQILSYEEAHRISSFILRQAVAGDIDPWLFLAIAVTESNCNTNLRGGSGEYGLMQVMPGTGQWIAEQLGYVSYTPECLWDIRFNTQCAAFYLRATTAEFADSIKGVLAYNKGSNGARNWLKSNSLESNCYVRAVMNNYNKYKP